MKTLFESEELVLKCFRCGKDLLNPPDGHLLTEDHWIKEGGLTRRFVDQIIWVCRACDSDGIYGLWGWNDIPDLFIPEYFIQKVVGIINELHCGTKFSDRAIENLLKLLVIVCAHISKEVTPEQRKTLDRLYDIPKYLGGLG